MVVKCYTIAYCKRMFQCLEILPTNSCLLDRTTLSKVGNTVSHVMLHMLNSHLCEVLKVCCTLKIWQLLQFRPKLYTATYKLVCKICLATVTYRQTLAGVTAEWQ